MPAVLSALLDGGAQNADGVERALASEGEQIAGQRRGAVHGRDAVPAQWRQVILSCRPHPLRAKRVRGRAYWPIDALELAERLLLAGSPV